VTALREVDKLFWPAIQETLAALGQLGEDSTAKKLAQRYAQVIDATPDAKQASVLRWLGPELLKVLEALGATPAARAAMTKGQKPATENAPNGLAKLRAAK
jgi:hypothetical protein